MNGLLASGRAASRDLLLGIDTLYRELGGQVLGIIPGDLTQQVGGELTEGLMNILLDIRARYREARDWERADALRDRLAELGIAIDDRPEGTTWRVEHGEKKDERDPLRSQRGL